MAEEQCPERQVEPRLSPQLAALREKLRAGTHQGESFEVTANNRELEEAIAWYVERRPRIPFRNPQVLIHPGGVEARGEAHLGKLHIRVGGEASISLEENLPVVTVERLEVGKVGLPGPVRSQVQAEVDKQLNVRREDLPAIIEGLELEDGQVTVRGIIR
jgi:hypothetical protein